MTLPLLTLAALLAPPVAQAADAPMRTAKLSAYCSACNTPRHSDTGKYGHLRKGDIAADKKYWPAGTRIYIVGIGLCRVRDTGGAIKGKDRFDCYLGWHKRCPCNGWGMRRSQYRRMTPARAEVAR